MKIRNVTTTIVLSLVCLSMSANAGIVEVGDGLGATLEDHLFDNFSDGGGAINANGDFFATYTVCLLYTSPSPRDQRGSRMPSSA